MKFNIYRMAALVAVAITLTSCGKDKEDPMILISSPYNHSQHMPGSTIAISAEFKDDRGLKSYEVFIGNEDGSMNHDFHFMDAGDITGKSYNYTGSIAVPDSLDTVYYLHFEVMDEEDKMSTDKVMLHFHN